MAVPASTIVFLVVALWGVKEIASTGAPAVGRCLKASRDSPDPGRAVGIIHGSPGKIEDYPFAVSLVRDWDARITRLCGGAIIGERWVLTAAQCLISEHFNITAQNLGEKRLYVYSNSTFWNKDFKERHLVVKYVIHHRYDVLTKDYDIAVVKVKTAFTGLNEKASDFAYTSYRYKTNRAVEMLGWGETMMGSGASPDLQRANGYLARFGDCKRAWESQYHRLSSRMVCVYGFKEGGCWEDNGGPLYRKGKIIGVQIDGTPCIGVPIPMTIYTKVSLFNNFIFKAIADNTGNKAQ